MGQLAVVYAARVQLHLPKSGRTRAAYATAAVELTHYQGAGLLSRRCGSD
ncbi:MAG: hypothetical protein HZA46_08740 [Planctomycetales bacterium]|nr:hypothetical protein [Planctomycetales bacterium]